MRFDDWKVKPFYFGHAKKKTVTEDTRMVVAGQHNNKNHRKIDQNTGKLTPANQVGEPGEPGCILFAPSRGRQTE